MDLKHYKKPCVVCSRELPLKAFPTEHAQLPDRCLRCQRKGWVPPHYLEPGMIAPRTRRTWFKFEWPLSENQRRQLRAWLGGKCSICGVEGRLSVDHDHKTNLVRGLLCTRCNWGLGQFGDDLERLNQAIGYLMKPPAQQPRP